MQCRQYYDGKLSLKKGRNWWNDVAFTINRYNDNSKKMQKAIYILHKNITNEFFCAKKHCFISEMHFHKHHYKKQWKSKIVMKV